MILLMIVTLHLILGLGILLIYRRESGRFFILTPFLIFIGMEIVFSWNFWLMFQEVGVEVTSHHIIVSASATASFMAGFLFFMAYYQLKGVPSSPSAFLKKPFRISYSRSGYSLSLTFLVLLGCTTGWLYYRHVPPAVEAATNLMLGEELEEARIGVSQGRRLLTKSHVFGGEYRGQGILKGILFTVWSYGLVLSLTLAFTRKRWVWWGWAVLFFLGVLYFIGGTGERSRVLWSLSLGLVGVSYVVRLNFRMMIAAGFVLMAVLFCITLLLPRFKLHEMERPILYQIAASIGQRLIQGNKINNVRAMNFVRDGDIKHSLGREHALLVMNTLPGIQKPPLAHRIANLAGKSGTTYFSGTYLGTVYVDFGTVGVVLIYFMMGILTQVAFLHFSRLPKNPETVVLLAFVSFALGNMSARAGVVSLVSNMIPILAIHALVVLMGTCLSMRAVLTTAPALGGKG